MTLRRFLTFLVTVAAFAWIVQASAASSGPPLGTGCIAHHPNYIEDTFEVQLCGGVLGARRAGARPRLERARLGTRSRVEVRATECRGLPGVRNRPDLLVRRHGQRREQPVRPGVPRGAVLSRCDRPQLHAQRRLRRLVRAGHVHGLLAGLEHPHDRAEAGLPRAGGLQRDADDRLEAPAARHARGGHHRHPLPRRLTE